MPIPRWARRPLAWLVAGEVAVCLALFGTAWHLIAGSAAAAGPTARLPVLAAPSPVESPVPAIPMAGGAAVPAPGRPGLATGGDFLGAVLSGLNSDQASFENGEWAALQALSGAMKLYIERVMLPAVERAERSAGGPR